MISALIWGVGLVLVIEGLVYALAPLFVENMLRQMSEIPIKSRRIFGVSSALLGAVMLHLVERFF
ncbi:DUF2065 domain-containing protein [Paracoccaceae bacterium]|nr:DUF2065 domain-containing protein [Paracoccaceae bacterium]